MWSDCAAFAITRTSGRRRADAIDSTPAPIRASPVGEAQDVHAAADAGGSAARDLPALTFDVARPARSPRRRLSRCRQS
jgi:hypothetical protein